MGRSLGETPCGAFVLESKRATPRVTLDPTPRPRRTAICLEIAEKVRGRGTSYPAVAVRPHLESDLFSTVMSPAACDEKRVAVF